MIRWRLRPEPGTEGAATALLNWGVGKRLEWVTLPRIVRPPASPAFRPKVGAMLTSLLLVEATYRAATSASSVRNQRGRKRTGRRGDWNSPKKL